MPINFSSAEQQTLNQLGAEVNVEALTQQLQSILITGDPVTYMESNINWEADANLENQEDKSLAFIDSFIQSSSKISPMSYTAWHPFRKFINWFKRNRMGSRIKRALCSISAKIKELIDEEAELKKIIELALLAIAAAFGIGTINPVLLTIMVGILAMMILKGVDQVCGV